MHFLSTINSFLCTVVSHKDLVRSTMTNSSAAFKIGHEWAINKKQFRGYAGVMDEKLVRMSRTNHQGGKGRGEGRGEREGKEGGLKREGGVGGARRRGRGKGEGEGQGEGGGRGARGKEEVKGQGGRGGGSSMGEEQGGRRRGRKGGGELGWKRRGRREGGRGLLFTFSPISRLVDQIRAMPEVKYVERNQEAKAFQACELQTGATWGLVRTTLRDWDGNPNNPPNDYSHDKNGKFLAVKGYDRCMACRGQVHGVSST